MRPILTLLTILFLQSCCINTSENGKKEIYKLMGEQQQAWNKGDLKSFMQPYWQSDSLTFVGGKSFTYGWQQTLERYEKGYPDKAAMGTLLFENKDYRQLGPEHALVIGKWNLFRIKDTLSGGYTLTWKKIDGNWKIIADHSS